MDLSTEYLGLKLKNPLVAAASPLTADPDSLKRLRDAGAAAVVLHSLFEEQLQHDAEELHHHTTFGTESYAESLSYFPAQEEYRLGPDEYLDHIRKAKDVLEIPVIASLNGCSPGGWTHYAALMQEAGADAIELNVYYIATDPALSSAQVEGLYIDALKAVKQSATVPVAIKVGPYFSAMANMATRLDLAGADGLVLFNRFYQPNINLDTLEVEPDLVLSSPAELRLPLRWIAVLYGHIKANLAANSGIATGTDVLKTLMAGADVAQLCSVLLRKGPEELANILAGMRTWMAEHDYESVTQLKGSLSQKSCPNPTAFERANYMKALNSYT